MPQRQDPQQDKPRTMRPGDQAPPGTPGTPGTGEALCPACGGSGKLSGQPCPECNGTGVIVQGIGGA